MPHTKNKYNPIYKTTRDNTIKSYKQNKREISLLVLTYSTKKKKPMKPIINIKIVWYI